MPHRPVRAAATAVAAATVGVVIAVVATLAACSAAPSPGPSSPSPSASPAGVPTGATSSTPATAAPTPSPPTRASVQDEGTAVRAARARLWVRTDAGAPVEVRRRDDGSAVVVVDGPAWVAGPGARVLPDGSALVGGGGLEPDGVRLSAAGDDVLRLDGPGALWFAGSAVEGTAWGDREGGRSLAVTPSAWARQGSDAAQALLRRQLVAAEPDAGSATMLDQLRCHEIGAPDKATWNLEPWRPDVGLAATIRALCNPA